MIDKKFELPFYAKTTTLLIGVIAIVVVLYIGKSIIAPLVFAVIFAILLNPVVDFFVRKKINRVLSIIITLFLTFLLIVGFVGLFFSQAVRFSESLPILIEKFTLLLNQTTTWFSAYFDVNPLIIQEWIIKTKSGLINNSGLVIGKTIVSLGNAIVVLLLIPIYVFMILFYQPLLLDFIRKLSGENNQKQAGEIITQTKSVIQHYLVGLVIEFVLVATMYTTILMILDIDYAILLGIIGALFNLIPYVGGLIGVALPMIIALTTKSTAWYSLYILVSYYIIQLIDNNLIVPVVVSSKVKINALFSIIVVIVGNAIWGISGMFLAIPLLAILKVIFDHVEPLKAWGFLLGDTMPHILKIKPIFKMKKRN